MKQIIGGVLLLCLAMGAQAETGGQGNGVAAVTSPAPAAAGGLTPETQAALERLYTVMKFDALIEQSKQTMFQEIDKNYELFVTGIVGAAGDDSAGLEQGFADSKPEFMRLLRDVTDAALTPAYMKELMAQLYGTRLTVKEIDDMSAFYATPTGAKLLSIQPQVSAEMMTLLQARMVPAITEGAQTFAESLIEKRSARTGAKKKKR